MANIVKTVTIKASVESIFDLITNPERVAVFIPGLIRVRNARLPLQNGSTFDWEYQFLGIVFHGRWVVEEIKRPHVYISRSEGGIASRWMYTIVPKGIISVLTLDIDYGPPDSLLKRYAQSFVEPHTDRLAETYLNSLKTYLETHSADDQPIT